MNKNISSEKRRNTLKLMMGAGTVAGLEMLPDQWTRPVISTAVLPGHAQSSGTCTSLGFESLQQGIENTEGNL